MIGKTISHYKILEKLGEGGMGIVYKAQDTKLDRIVAVKFLPKHLLCDEEAKTRFVHEAKAASSLDHPNIATIHEIDEAEGECFISMTYIEGQSVKDKIALAPLKLDEALDIAIQVAEGLQEAHDKGIVHRDIKSDNIMVTSKGQAKIMDFGLAKLKGVTRLTKTGATLGTTQSMSPEQAQGMEVDQRSDIFSFGVVLYEMFTGQLPFKGEHDQAVIYSILNEDPEPMTGLRTGVPLELERIVDKALEKKKEDRYQHVEDMLIDLRRLKRDTSEVLPKSMKALTIKGRKLRTTRLILGGLAAVAIIFIIISIFSNKFIKRETAKQIEPTHRQITFSGKVSYPAISPDGNFIAYVSEVSAAEEKVFVQDLTGGLPLEVFKDKSIYHLRWSPDGSELLISAENDSISASYIVPRLGGTSRKMTHFFLTRWSPDGSHFAGSWVNQKRIWFTNKSTGDTTSISLDGSFTWFHEIDWSPVGDLLLFLTEDQEQYTIWTIRTDGTQQYKIVEDSVRLCSPRWSSKGDAIYYFRSHGRTEDLMKIKIAPSTGKAKGPARVIQTGLQAGSFFTLSEDNKRLLYTRLQSYSNLWLVSYDDKGDAKSVKTKQLTTGTSSIYSTGISPDGKQVAFSMGSPSQTNIFVIPIEDGRTQQLTFLNSYNAEVAWSPDGKEIAFSSTQGGAPKVWRVNSNGGTPRPFDKSELSGSDFLLTWSPGSNILYQRPGNRNFHFLDPKTEEEKPLVENDSVGWMFYPRYSPDGKKVAVYWNRRPTRGLWMISLEDSSQVLLHSGYISPIEWSSDGNWIYGSYISFALFGWDANILSPKILMIPVSGGQAKEFVTLSLENITGISMDSDKKKFVCAVLETQSDVWLMENFDPEVK
jgi:serine/threonine protein kinase